MSLVAENSIETITRVGAEVTPVSILTTLCRLSRGNKGGEHPRPGRKDIVCCCCLLLLANDLTSLNEGNGKRVILRVKRRNYGRAIALKHMIVLIVSS